MLNRNPLMAITLGAFAAGTLVAAPAEALTQPASRADKRLFLSAKRVSNMTFSPGNAPEFKEEKAGLGGLLGGGAPAKNLAGLGKIGGGWDGGGGGAPAPQPSGAHQFLRFLEQGLQQSYNKSHQDGFNTLNRFISNALNTDTSGLPPGFPVALRAAQKATSGISWKASWEVLHTAVKGLVERPEPFMQGPVESFRGMLALGRLCSQEKSYQDGFKIIRAFAQALLNAKPLIPDQLHEQTLRANIKATGGLSWENSWKCLANGTARLSQGVPNLGHYFAVAIAADDHMSFQDGFKTLQAFIQGAVAMQNYFPNELSYLAARTTLKATSGLGWESSWRVAAAGCEALQDAVMNPQQFYRVALRCGEGRSGRDGFKVFQAFANAAVSAGEIDQFSKMSIRTALQATSGQSWDASYQTMLVAFRQQA